MSWFEIILIIFTIFYVYFTYWLVKVTVKIQFLKYIKNMLYPTWCPAWAVANYQNWNP